MMFHLVHGEWSVSASKLWYALCWWWWLLKMILASQPLNVFDIRKRRRYLISNGNASYWRKLMNSYWAMHSISTKNVSGEQKKNHSNYRLHSWRQHWRQTSARREEYWTNCVNRQVLYSLNILHDVIVTFSWTWNKFITCCESVWLQLGKQNVSESDFFYKHY